MPVNDDQGIQGGSNPTGQPNAAQESQLKKNQGTESKNSANNAGDGNAQSNANTGSADAPGRRIKNPLGALSSYTYQLSLYMITPDAYDAFTASGRRQIDALEQAVGEGTGGAYLIAESAGVNNNESQRAPGFDNDFYIDNLKLKQAISGEATQSSTNIYEVSFDIIEPYSFSFNTKLKEASDALQEYSNDSGYSGNGSINNPSRQFFILGVNFLGYDANGNLASGDIEFGDGPIDPNADGNKLFQVYYDIAISSVKFTIAGGATTYYLKGVALAPGKAFGTKRGRIHATKTIGGKTFHDALMGEDGLFEQLNEFESWKVNEAKTQEFPNTFEVAYIGDGVDAIKNATLILPTDTDKSKWYTDNIKNTMEATDAAAAKAVADDAKRKIVLNTDTTFIEVFDEILKGSSYIYDALQLVYQSQPEPEIEGKEQPSVDPNSATAVAWYKVTTNIAEAKWDSIVADWSYKTIFTIEKYETPIITSIATNAGIDYYGPHKRYKYWYTGENSEILQYEQKLDNLFYNEVLGNPNINEDGAGTGGSQQTPVAPNQNTPQPSMNSLGGGRATQNQYVTSLYSPDSYAEAKIKLLGDPDFLVQEHRSGPDAAYNRFYGEDGYRVSANGGQVFIEIDFLEAIDYNTNAKNEQVDNGVLHLNDSILFFKYPDYIADKIEGVSYKVVTVTSSFTGGRFEQDLSCVINTFPDANSDKKDNPRETEGEDNKLEGKNQTKNAGDQDFVGPRRDPETTDGNNDDGGG